MKTLLGPVAVCICCLLAVACHKNDHDNNNNPSKGDEAFMNQAAYANLGEQDAGALAASKALDSSVKAFGQQMVNEHGDAYNELKDIAAEYNNTSLPTTPDSLHKLIKDTLMSLSGHAFDSAYIAGQIRDHTAAIALFQNEAQNGTGKLKDYAVKYLPHIQEHLAKADSIQAHF